MTNQHLTKYTQKTPLSAEKDSPVVEVLVSTMNLSSHAKLIRNMRLKAPSVTINQSHNKATENNKTPGHRLYTYNEKGLSLSRNRALLHSKAEICLITDDDLRLESDYADIISRSFKENPNADVIIFAFRHTDGKIKKLPKGRVRLLGSMRASSVQIAFRIDSIINSGISFDQNFGTGSKFYMGEENIFLADCLANNLIIYSDPKVILSLGESESTWSRKRNQNFFYIRGRVFYRMTTRLAIPLAIQFAIRKAGRSKNSISILAAIKASLRGVRDQSKT